MKRLIFSLTLLALLIAACAPMEAPQPGQPGPTETPIPPTATPIPAELTPAQLIALNALAQTLNLPTDQITLVSTEAVDWPDGCLGVYRPEVTCIQMITPGFRIVLEAGGRQYEYHANADGRVVISATLALTWHRQGGIAGFCDTLLVHWSGHAVPMACGLRIAYPEGELTADELAQLNAWAAKFGAVTLMQKDDAVADAMTVSFTLNGYGAAQPTGAEQQEMLAWVQEVYARLTK
jgi:hypothetical protein